MTGATRPTDFLRCPICQSVMVENLDNAAWRCSKCERVFPIVDGTPRFAAAAYLKSFGRQWNRYDVARWDEDEAVFRVKTGIDPEALAGLDVLDAGCGGGRYSLLAARSGANVVGVDLSDAVEKARSLCSDYPNALIVQADLLSLPLAECAFDVVFSIGVLHHCPDPRGAFASVARRVKPGGTLAVWLYRQNTPPQELLNKALRRVTTRLPARVLEPLCVGLGVLGGVPMLNKGLNKLFNFSNHPDWTLRVCDNFDWYAPRYQSHHTIAELTDWFHAEGFEAIEPLPPARGGRFYQFAYEHNMIIGSGVNVRGVRKK